MKIAVFDSLKELIEKNKKRIGSLVLTAGIAFTTLVGCGTTSKSNDTNKDNVITSSSIVTEKETTTTKVTTKKQKVETKLDVNIDSKYEKQIKKIFKDKETITQEDLDNVKEFEITFSNKDDLEYLTLFNNLSTIKVDIDNYGDLYYLPVLNSVTKVELSTVGYFSNDIADLFTQKFPNLEYLKSSNKNVVFEPGAVEKMTQLKKFKLYLNQNCDIHFDELTFLDKIAFNDIDPYDMAISFNSNEFNALSNNGVEIEFANKQVADEYFKISDKLDEIVASLNVNEYSTKEEKIDAVLRCTLENLEYDRDVLSLVSSGTECSKLLGSFYIKGFLYGALEMDTQISII